MCGIIGFFNFKESNKLVKKSLELIKNRGLDGFGILTEDNLSNSKTIEELDVENSKNWAIGHNLHSIVNFVPQPFTSSYSFTESGHGTLTSTHESLKCASSGADNVNENTALSINCEIYNWKELNEKYQLDAKNDAELVFKFLNQNFLEDNFEILDELDGVYACIYKKGDKVYLFRDIIGIKPLWYSLDEKLAVSSEKKVLFDQELRNIEELNPRVVIEYDINSKEIKIHKRKFFELIKPYEDNFEAIKEKVKELTRKAIEKRVPEKEFGVLFSGGIDSTFIAYTLKQLGLKFTCYTAALDSDTEADDLKHAKEQAKLFNFNLKYKTLKIDEIPPYLEKLVPLIEDSNVVKVGVGLTFYVACELAKQDGIKVIFSGLGSEELFAGYKRHENSIDINEECLSGVRKIYERDMYRDDVITMNNNLELRLPFLDKKLTRYALNIDPKWKIRDGLSKMILRDVAKDIGIPEDVANRPKKAAQYGSRFDKALQKLAKRNGFKTRSDYLKQFYPYPNVKLAALISGGKDSLYAMHIMQKQNYNTECFITMKSKNTHSYMFHTPNINIAELQAQACELPIIVQETDGEKEHELADLKKAIKRAKDEHGIEGVTSGAIFSNYQRERIDKICDELGIKNFSPLWHMNQELEMRNLLEEGFQIMFSSVAAYGLNKSWVGRLITPADIDKLAKINEEVGLNVAGEGGEFESLVIDAPFFRHKIKILESEVKKGDTEEEAYFNINKAELEKKGY